MDARAPLRRLLPKSTLVLIVDVQERLASAMPAVRVASVLRGARILVEGARVMGANVVATEQYPRGLGPTCEPVRAALGVDVTLLEKLTFSAATADGFADALGLAATTTVVVAGMETHVCVFQTVRDLTARGLEVYVAADAVCSRDDEHRALGLALCERAGATLTTAETILFDWLERAGSAEFKQISALVR